MVNQVSRNSWDAAADRELLLGVLKTHNITVDNNAMAAYMKSKGFSFTASAIQNRMARLRKMLESGNNAGEAGDTPKQKTTTGRKRGAAAPADDETLTKKSKGGKAANRDDDEESTAKEEVKAKVAEDEEWA